MSWAALDALSHTQWGRHGHCDGPSLKNPVRYLTSAHDRSTASNPLPTADLVDAFTRAGWADLSNTRAALTVGGQALEFVGVDDPHLIYDRYAAVAGRNDPSAALTASAAPAGAAWMEVSAGLGTSPCAPVRFACRPEATLLTLPPGLRLCEVRTRLGASGRARIVSCIAGHITFVADGPRGCGAAW
jgi:hypothetical protein